MRPRFRYSLSSLLWGITFACFALWMNVQPKVDCQPGRYAYLYAGYGWPFRYLHDSGGVQGLKCEEVHAGRWPRGWPSESNFSLLKLLADVLAWAVAIPLAILGVELASRVVKDFRARIRSGDLQLEFRLSGCRLRLVPATLLTIVAIPLFVIGTIGLVFQTWHWIDSQLEPTRKWPFLDWQVIRQASECCLAVLGSVLLILAAKACLHLAIRRAAIYVFVAVIVIAILITVLAGQ